MRNVLRSEWRKVTTTRLWWGLLLAALAIAALSTFTQIAGGSSGGPPGVPPPDPFAQVANQRSLATAAAAGGVFALVFGIVVMTTEFRHLTSRPTFLIQPRRERVVAAKLLVAAAVGAAYGIASVAVVVAIMGPWLSAKGVTIGWLSGGVLATLAETVLAMALYALLGVGVGVLVRNQLAAVIGALVVLFIVENVVLAIPDLQGAWRFLPVPAADQLVGTRIPDIGGPALTPLEGGLVFFGWGLLLAICGWLTTLRRDIP
jgi:ABC-type transport system involved in multi-copper enzyme maturation permease subunit